MPEVQVLTPPNSELFASISQFDHELVLFCNDNTTGLKAIIAVHNTTLGPALGGLRMWNYYKMMLTLYLMFCVFLVE